MALFAIGDLHLSFGTNKPMDVFSGWHNYVEKLENQWRRLVKPEDWVVLPGDLSWGMDLKQSLKDFEFLESLPGKKVILKGNHDYWWSTKRKMEDFFAENGLLTLNILHNNHYIYEKWALCGSRGWINETDEPADLKVLNREAGRLAASLDSAKASGLTPLVFLHYPPVYASQVNQPILDVLKRFNVAHCFYGHIHGQSAQFAVNGLKDGVDYRLVASDYLGFCPKKIF